MTDEDHEWYARYRNEVELAHWIKSELASGRAIESAMIYSTTPQTGHLKLDVTPLWHPDCPVKLTFS